MTTLGTIQLSDHLVLDGLDSAPPIAHSQRRTLGGQSVVQTAPSVGGRVLTLRADNHLTLDQVRAVRAVAAAGQPVQMAHSRGTYTVLITGLDVHQAIDCADPDGTTWYTGTITMIEV